MVVLPYFSGERTPIQDPNTKGVIFGLTMNHTKGHLFRAALEGVGYSIQHILQTMNQAGASAEKISAVGGGTKSPVWLQAVSDITGVPQDIPSVTFGASYGNAFLAGFAAGLIPSQDEIQRWVNVSHRVKPNPDNEATYKELMNKYLILYPRTADLM
ncbi:Carbohydrate kinase FGGY (fragment) [Vibrio nigripulchritudo SOn1]|uniref:Carbohydrate kinase FGGY n=1 Tax=Vibrio nigripulchritudo SOn1 TaxID=1238450 RepID=A0AAV2VL22_9VIBR